MKRLIVEGKDDMFFIGELCKNKFPNLKDSKLIIPADGIGNLDYTIATTLKASGLTHLGIVVDADKNAEKRFKEIIKCISKFFDARDLSSFELNQSGCVMRVEDINIGIWVMPNNQDAGELEHFILNLVDENDEILEESTSKVDELLTKDYCRFKEKEKEKAIIRTWLAWQKEPGLPFGTALEAKYLTRETPYLEPFFDWINRTFEYQ